MVARDSSTAAATSSRSDFISTMSALSMATSVPAPMARPTSARARAGASLMPSPTMATFLPSAWRAATFRSLSWGRTSASTEVTPSSLPMASAVRRLSPVSMTTSSPSSRNAATASLLVGLGVSATAMTPSNFLSVSSPK